MSGNLIDSGFVAPVHTDEELSAEIGRPVLTYYSEDLGVFKDTLYDFYSDTELSERAANLKRRWLEFCPASDHVSLFEVAKDSADYVGGLLNTLGTREKHLAFGLLKASKLSTPTDNLRYQLNDTRYLINNPIPKEDSDYITLRHELHHARLRAKNEQPDEINAEEFECDKRALQDYLDAGGSTEVVRAHIQNRALTTLFGEVGVYDFAHNLHRHFFSHDSETPDPLTSTRVMELRVRLYAELIGHKAITHCPSEYLQKEIHGKYFDDGFKCVDPVLDKLLATEDDRERIKDYRDPDLSSLADRLEKIASNPAVDSNTQLYAQLARQAALQGELRQHNYSVDILGKDLSKLEGHDLRNAEWEDIKQLPLAQRLNAAFDFAVKRTHIIGAVATLAEGTYKTGKLLLCKDFEGASNEAKVSGAEAAGNIFGFCFGDDAKAHAINKLNADIKQP